MISRPGLVSLLLGLAAWLLLMAGLVMGGLDNSGPVDGRVFVVPALLSGLAGFLLGLVALVGGRQRVLAALGLCVSAIFVMSFVGVLPWALF